MGGMLVMFAGCICVFCGQTALVSRLCLAEGSCTISAKTHIITVVLNVSIVLLPLSTHPIVL